jgi:hypothetical protein
MTDFPDTPDLSDIQTDLTRERPATVGELTRELSKMTQERFDRVVPLPVVKAIIEGTVEYAFRECARLGHFRLPGGWGTLQLRWIKGTEKPNPAVGGGLDARPAPEDDAGPVPPGDAAAVVLRRGTQGRAVILCSTSRVGCQLHPLCPE